MTIDKVQQEINSLTKGDIIWVTRDYAEQGIVYPLVFLDSSVRNVNGGIWAAPSLDQKDEEDEEVYLLKPHWHTTPQAAFRRITEITIEQQYSLLVNQQEAMKFLLGEG